MNRIFDTVRSMRLWIAAFALLCSTACGSEARTDPVVTEWCAQVEVAGQLSIEVYASPLGAARARLGEQWNLELEKLRGLDAPDAIHREFASMRSPSVALGSDQYWSLGNKVADFLEESCPDVSSEVVSVYRGVDERFSDA